MSYSITFSYGCHGNLKSGRYALPVEKIRLAALGLARGSQAVVLATFDRGHLELAPSRWAPTGCWMREEPKAALQVEPDKATDPMSNIPRPTPILPHNPMVAPWIFAIRSQVLFDTSP